MGALNIALLVIMVISAIFTVILVLMHSGKGTGVSDMISSSVYGSQGTSIVEKNLDRITIVLAVVFFVTIIALMFVYPQGTIGGL